MKKNLIKKDLIKSIYYNIGFSKIVSENIVHDIFKLFLHNINKNDKLKISKFGTFSKKYKKERIGRNPKTLEEKIILSRNVIVFKASTYLKKKINE